MGRLIPYGRQAISQDDIDAVVAVLQSDLLTQGPAVPAFEAALCALTGAPHAIVVSSATAALHVACLALGVGPGDRVWTSPNSFVASANCALYCGAEVDFVDIDPRTLNLCPQALAQKLALAASSGQIPKLVIPVDFAGRPSELGAYRQLADQYGFFLIEDASHAVGAIRQKAPLGAQAAADITVFSFHPVKIVTTAEGGALLTHCDNLAHKLRLLRSHGITRDLPPETFAAHGPWWYEQHALGFNYRMTDLQAALGTSQLRRIEAFAMRRREISAYYDQQFAPEADEGKLILPAADAEGDQSALHLYPIQVLDRARAETDNEAETGASAPVQPRRRQVFDALRAAGLGVNVHYIPIHLQPFWRARGFREGQFPVAERYYERAISLPLHPSLSDADLAFVVQAVRAALA
jgi:UDP-4-amino-4,6-dideoxy-N-acetyl-beta-L-altrosamine transaminase